MPALALQVVGHGLFKPGISISTGGTYFADNARRERSFLTQQPAVNIGAMAGPLCAEWSRAAAWSGCTASGYLAGSVCGAIHTLLAVDPAPHAETRSRALCLPAWPARSGLAPSASLPLFRAVPAELRAIRAEQDALGLCIHRDCFRDHGDGMSGGR